MAAVQIVLQYYTLITTAFSAKFELSVTIPELLQTFILGGQVWSSPITADLSRGFEAIRAAAGVAATAEVPDGFPASFPSTGSGFTFVPQETGGSDAACGIPAEFVFQPADIRLYFTAGSFGLEGRAGGLRTLYREAITKIDHCADKDCDNCAGETSAVSTCTQAIRKAQAVYLSISVWTHGSVLT